MDMYPFPASSQVSAFEKPPMTFPNLGEILVSTGRLSAEAVGRVTARQRERGIPFGAAAIELGLVTEADVHAALSRQFDYPVLSVGDQGADPEIVAAFEPNSPRVEALRKRATARIEVSLAIQAAVKLTTAPATPTTTAATSTAPCRQSTGMPSTVASTG